MRSALAEKLLGGLLACFAERGLRVHNGSQPFASFSAAHPDVGDLQLYDDVSEVILCVGELTHGHFACYDDTLPPDKREDRVVEEVTTFLEEIFADRVEFWNDGQVGGWGPLGNAVAAGRPSARRFVWSGPIAAETR